jgi:phosphatidylserine/phosphatidylglycerophosphate/cardiolipin synthase-like enzyme
LRDGGVAVRWSSASFTYTHAKTIIVDRSHALVLTLNLTRSSFDSNREFGIVTTRAADVASAQAIFDADWNGQTETDPGDLVVSPLNSRGELLALIRSATKTIDIYAEVVRDRDIVGQLEREAKSGVTIRLMTSPDTDPADLAVLDELAKAGIEIRLVASPYIHAKAVIVDGARTFVGSENFTATSLNQNREIGLVTDDRAVTARLTAVFERDFAGAKAYR